MLRAPLDDEHRTADHWEKAARNRTVHASGQTQSWRPACEGHCGGGVLPSPGTRDDLRQCHQGQFCQAAQPWRSTIGPRAGKPLRKIVVDRLFDGKTQLTSTLQPLMLAAEETLQFDEDKRKRTIVRLDAEG